jgi:hypothetical protein
MMIVRCRRSVKGLLRLLQALRTTLAAGLTTLSVRDGMQGQNIDGNFQRAVDQGLLGGGHRRAFRLTDTME